MSGFRLPRFLRSRRSRRSHSPKPSLAGPHDDALAAAPSSFLDPPPVLSSHPSSSMRSAPEQDVVAATEASRSPALSNLTPPQNSTGRLYADRAQRDSNDQSSPVLQPITQISAVDSTRQSEKYLPQPEDREQGMFNRSQNFSATGVFVDGNVVYNTTPSNQFMKDLLKVTIPGAASDSSARYPPPRCHPGTRLAVLKGCLLFISQCDGRKKMRWVVGKAGVGKSAIMQSVTESPELTVTSNASVFFSINGRNDGTKAIMTLSYQFAVESATYRQIIEDEVTRNPSLLHSSMPVQFEKFIVQPFIHNRDLNSAGRVLAIIDGLDECSNTATQVELLRLISNFCISYPSSPIVWLIASRPEMHIASFFSRAEVMPVYEKEEILVDTDEARADVEQFLRAELMEIGKATDFLSQNWPDEEQFLKLAKAAGGLFAYAQTVIRYIGDSTIGDPVSQLSDVLNVIDANPMFDVPPEEHPMALLDALYARILSNIPSKIMINARKLLLLLASDWNSVFVFDKSDGNFVVLCNWLGITANEAYAAANRLRSVLDFPQRNQVHRTVPRPFHKSFIDYLFRSGFSSDIKLEAQQLKMQCAFRVLKEAPSGIDFGDAGYGTFFGELARNIGAPNKIRITWPASEEIDWDDSKTRLSMYKLAVGEVVEGVQRGNPVFQSQFCISFLTTRFKETQAPFPHHELCDLVFDARRRHEYVTLGILKQIPSKALVIPGRDNYYEIRLQFRHPTTMPLSNPWNPSCKHRRTGQCEQGKEQNWATIFGRNCVFCFKRMECQFESWSIQSPDHAALIMFTSSRLSCVEFRYVDPEDGASEWTYRWWIELSFEERRKLGSTI